MYDTISTERNPSQEEELRIHRWRSGQLERLGVPASLAELLADRVDWHEIAALMERGCPLGLALEIVR